MEEIERQRLAEEIVRFHGRKTEEEKREARRAYDKEYKKRYRVEHPREPREKRPLQTKGEAKEVKKRWCLANPDKVRAQKKRAYASRKARGKTISRAQMDFGIVKYTDLKHAMQRLNLQVTWGREDFLGWFQKQEKKCFYCKKPLRLQVGLGWSALSLDRLDPTKGYEKDNVVLACKKCNSIKSNWFTPDQMKEIAQKYFGG